MTCALRFLPDVAEDMTAGYFGYEDKTMGLGEEFLRMAYACSNEILQYPRSHAPVYGEFRRRLLRRFLYGIYYMIKEHEVIVFGLFHCARPPNGSSGFTG